MVHVKRVGKQNHRTGLGSMKSVNALLRSLLYSKRRDYVTGHIAVEIETNSTGWTSWFSPSATVQFLLWNRKVHRR